MLLFRMVMEFLAFYDFLSIAVYTSLVIFNGCEDVKATILLYQKKELISLLHFLLGAKIFAMPFTYLLLFLF